jgi:sulfofructose kinase
MGGGCDVMAAAPRVISLGISVLDQVWELPAIPTEPTKVTAVAQRETGGGMAATAAAAVAALGGRSALWGRLGDDWAAGRLAAMLGRLGVDIGHLRRFPGARTPVSAVLVDRAGERLLAVYPGDALPADPAWLPLAEVAEAGAVLADCRWPEGALALFAAARRAGVPSVLDADVLPDPDALAPLAAAADAAIFSERGLAGLTRTTDPDIGLARAAEMAPGLVGVTLGAEGFRWREGARVQHIPAFRVTAADTTGAGDVFHGAYALALAEGRSARDAARFAGAAAALKCARGRGWDGLPDRPTVEAMLREERHAAVGR